ncbi:flavodoxin reductase [Leptospira ryugenii]|uniref:Flavodoxin reductase n=1 Tax=Leptospira ryugenii TaxID=1917863 RepID=A0A2P2E296_9LEPT|nr:iron-sulfur cluster-binding domain-containing protein [Leptospira ryugenii]GBF51023.1 flavodoxin reductase [Leptospira ryugenii]
MKTFPFIYNQPKDFLNSLQWKDWADFLLGEINPLFSFTETKAKVIDIREETADSRTFVLRTNRNWKGIQAGQHFPVSVEIAGRKVTRFYSLSGLSKEKRTLQITVKKQAGGLVSHYLNERTQVGDILGLGAAQGDFVLPKTLPNSILFLAGGSGITPVHSLLQDLKERNFQGKAKLLYFSRHDKDIILQDSLDLLEKENSWLEIKHVLTDIKSEEYDFGFLSKKMLEDFAPNWKESLVYLCGPAPLQNSAKQLLAGAEIKSELFLLPNQRVSAFSSNGPKEVSLLLSHKTVQIKGEKSILEELEEIGIFAPSGCRMGICHTCVCKKKSGAVSHMVKEEASGEGEENIQICVSRAVENLELEL